MTFKEYILFTRTTAIYPTEPDIAISYLVLGLVSEAGEVAGVFKKCIRDENYTVTPAILDKFEKEIGDVFWYLARLIDELGLDFEDILELNKLKLTSRKTRNQLGGSGDDR